MVPVNRDIALHHTGTFYHVSVKNRDGTPARCRANGRCKTWKRRPDAFRLPVKHGLRDCFYLTEDNCHLWEVEDQDWAKVQRTLTCIKLGVDPSIPDFALRDLIEEKGL